MDLHIDFLTLLVGLACNLVALSVALPLIMGRQVSHAARCTQGYMVLKALVRALARHHCLELVWR